MTIAETPDSVSFPGDPTRPSPFGDRVEGDTPIIAVAVTIGFLTVVNDNNRIRTEYLLNPIVDNLNLRGIVLVVLVHLPEHIEYYDIRLRCVQDTPQTFSTFDVGYQTWQLKYLGVGKDQPFWHGDPCFAKFLHPIPPDHFRGVKLDVEYLVGFSIVKTKYAIPCSQIPPYLEGKK